MGFSGGSSNVTKAHQHDSSVTQDGGALAANATQFGLTDGSMLVSDGTNVQELGVGASGYVLGTASGTSPTWEAVAGASGAWEQVFSDTIGGSSNVITNTFTAIPSDDYAMFCLQVQAGFSSDSDILMQFHDGGGVITTGYSTAGIRVYGGSATYNNDQLVAWAKIDEHGGRKSVIATVFFTMGNSNLADDENRRFAWWAAGSTGGGSAAGFTILGGNCNADPIESLDGITLYADAVGGGNAFQAGSKVTLWKIS